MSQPWLSAAIIALNEEEKIGDCIDSLSFSDEIVVVDSGSTDGTKRIVEEKGATFLYHPWQGHIGQKNRAIDSTCGQWILSLDADERISGKLRSEILDVMQNDQSADAYAIPRVVYYINRWVKHCGWYPARKVRLFTRGSGRWGGENPHDRIMTTGRVENLRGDIYHLSFDTVSDHLSTINSFTSIAAKERLAKGQKVGLFSILIRPPATFFKMFFLRGGFLDGVPGLVISLLSAYHVFCKYVKISEGRSE